MTSRLRLVVLAGALVFLAAHLAHLPQTLEDIDSINFAMGVEAFDVVNHRPHPPGYPLFIGLAKVSTSAVGVIRPGWDRDRRAAAGLAVLGALAGALAVLVLTRFWVAAGLTEGAAVLAALVTVASPLFWLTAARPLSDVAGLVLAVFVQTALLRGLSGLRDAAVPSARAWIVAVAGAGLAIGFRSQSVLLTAPFIAWGLVILALRQRWRDVGATIGAAAAGVLIWFVPLVLATGVGAYISVVTSQSADDFAGPHMLAVSLTGRRLSTYLGHTFVFPWQERTFAHVVLALSLIGAVVAALRSRRLIGVAAAGFLPYLVFHLAFQETITIRYALPMIVPVAGLAVYALSRLGMRAAMAGAVVIVAAGLAFGEPRLAAYAREGAPAFRAFQEMQRKIPSLTEAPALRMHHQVWWAVRRVADWYRPTWDAGPQPFPGDREWLGVVERFRGGDERPVWFLAHLARTDLAAFDPRTTERVGTYASPPALRELIGGARTDTFAWWSIGKPGWMIGPGWALTPELAGMTEQDRPKRGAAPAEAFIARQAVPMRLVIGGRYLGPDGGPAGRVTVQLDGRPIGERRVSSNPRWFLQWIDMPDGTAAGSGPYALLTVHVAPEAGGAVPQVGLEQFDAAPADASVYAFATGWFEHEENPTTGQTWRWMSGRATVEVRGGARDRTLTFAGESPARYFRDPPEITVRAGERVLGKYTFTSNFSQTVPVPADALGAAGGLITIESSRTFKPGDLQPGSPDQRDLSLRMYAVTVK